MDISRSMFKGTMYCKLGLGQVKFCNIFLECSCGLYYIRENIFKHIQTCSTGIK